MCSGIKSLSLSQSRFYLPGNPNKRRHQLKMKKKKNDSLRVRKNEMGMLPQSVLKFKSNEDTTVDHLEANSVMHSFYSSLR